MSNKYLQVCCDDIPKGMTRAEFFAKARRQARDERLIDAESPDDAAGGRQLFDDEVAAVIARLEAGEIGDDEARAAIVALAKQFFDGSPARDGVRTQAADRRPEPKFDAVKLKAYRAQAVARHPGIKEIARLQLDFEDERREDSRAVSVAARHPTLTRLADPLTGQTAADRDRTTSNIRSNLGRIGVLEK